MSEEILLTSQRMIRPETVKLLEEQYQVHHWWRTEDPDQLLRDIGDRVRVLVTEGWAPAEFQAKLPQLQLIASFGVGYDGVDVPAANTRQIGVTNTPGVLDDAVADLALGLLIAVTRGMVSGDRFVREGLWQSGPMQLMTHLRGRTAGILGLGRIGLAIASRLEAFGVKICYHNRRSRADVSYPYFSNLVEMAEKVDFLILSCVGGASTFQIVNQAVLEALGPDGVLVNVARGSVVDEEALVDCLQKGLLGGAGLDVFANEPQVPEGLLTMPQVVLQPHMGSATVQTRLAMGQLVLDNVEAFLNNRPLLTPVPNP